MSQKTETSARTQHERILAENCDESGVYLGLATSDLMSIGSARGNLRVKVEEERERFPQFTLSSFIPTDMPEKLEEITRAEFRKMGAAVRI